MTKDEFDHLELASLDTVEITFKNGIKKTVFLHQGHAHVTHEEALHTAILIVGGDDDIDRVNLFDVRSVKRIDRVEIN